MKASDSLLVGAVASVWGAFTLIYWGLGMYVSAMTWGAGTAFFTLLALALGSARRRARRDVAAPVVTEAYSDALLIGAVAAVWIAFAIVYWGLEMYVSAMTWGAGASFFVLLTLGLGLALPRAARRVEDGQRE